MIVTVGTGEEEVENGECPPELTPGSSAEDSSEAVTESSSSEYDGSGIETT